MIKEFVQRWEANKLQLQEKYSKKQPADYKEIVTDVIKILSLENEYSSELNPDPDRVHQIDDGDYQGTLLFVIAEKGYQPSDYYFIKVSYGSCSGCDTLQDIRDSGPWDSELPNPKQIDGYMTLALHVVQGLKVMGGDSV